MHKLSAYIIKHRNKILIYSTFLSFIYFLWGINSWKFSYVGDSWACFAFAKKIVENNFLMYPFSFTGVFNENSVLASFEQALFMGIFGPSNFSWRLSNAILIFPLSYFFYKWLKLTIDWKVALISTLLLQFSFYLSTFFKIGYYTPQALILFVMALYYAALSSQYPTRKNGFILGNILGFSFYIYVGPIFPLLIWPYFLSFIREKNKRKIVQYIVTVIVTYVTWIMLLLPNIQTITGPQGKTVLRREFTENSQIITNIGNNLLVFYKEFPIIPTHFIPFAYLDLISQILAFIGTIAAVGLISERRIRNLLLVYLSTVVILGITNPYSSPPISRGMMLVIFGFIFAALGLNIISKTRFLTRKIIIPIICCIVLLNIYLGQIAAFNRIGYTSMALIMKSLMEIHENSEKEFTLLLSENLSINSYLYDIPRMQTAYELQDIHIKILRPSTTTCEMVANKKVYMFSYDFTAQEWHRFNNCENSNISTQVLTTNILYY